MQLHLKNITIKFDLCHVSDPLSGLQIKKVNVGISDFVHEKIHANSN